MRTAIDTGFRLSPQQKRLWLLQQDHRVYNAWCAIKLHGELATDELTRVLSEIVQRHQILRTSFHRLPGTRFPLQVVNQTASPEWTHIDLSSHKDDKREAEVRRIIAEEKRRPFALARESLLRASLVTISTSEHLLLLTLPSLCADPRTLNNIYLEISRDYGAASVHDEKFSEEATPYIQFSEWQNELLDDDDDQSGQQFWLKHDLSSAATLALPFKLNPRSEVLDVSVLEHEIEPPALVALKAVAETAGTPLSNVLLSCWQILLWKLSGQPSSLVIGCAHDGRSFEELQNACGLFVKYLPLESHLDETLKFTDYLKRTAAQWHEADEWQEYFSWEAVDCGEETDASSAHFSFGFDFYDREIKRTTAGLTFSIVNQGAYLDRFKVRLSVALEVNSLSIGFHYDANIVARETAERLAQQFQRLLSTVGECPEAPVGDLEVLGDNERNWLLFEVNANYRDLQTDKCFYQLFEEQAERRPDAIAVVFENQQLNYRELNERANQLAHFLQTLGVKPEVRVGMLCERSLEMVTALMGVAKAGGAYVPIDPVSPGERLAFMLRDAQVDVLLTQERLVAGLPKLDAQIVCLDADWPVIASQPSSNLSLAATPENLCYILYTSGSTGKPKGVAVEHRQLVNYLCAITEVLSPSASESFATVSTLAADLGNTAIFPALCGGGTLHVISHEGASNASAFAEYISNHKIDCVKIVPSHLGALVASLPGAEARVMPRRQLVLGGEASRRVWAEQLQQLSPSCRVLNHYGPTETTVGVLTHVLRDNSCSYPGPTLPLGRPLVHTRVYILDRRLRPVPIGIAGELCVAGEGLTRGYWNHPDLTAEKFIPDPFSDTPGARLYRTGDLTRYLPGGEIEFLGRIDDQVKIRGYRIELGEIAKILSEHRSVRETVIITRKDQTGDDRLVAYVVCRAPHSLTVTEMRAHLGARLPEYMIPAAFVVLKSMPLTPNGKVDRQALPIPELVNTAREREIVAPRTEIEKLLIKMWAELLKVEQISIDYNFFELGGHSLLATQLISRVREEFKIELPLSSLFEHPTVASLATEISQIQTAPGLGSGPGPPRTITPSKRRPEEEILEKLDELSAEEVQKLLASLISGERK